MTTLLCDISNNFCQVFRRFTRRVLENLITAAEKVSTHPAATFGLRSRCTEEVAAWEAGEASRSRAIGTMRTSLFTAMASAKMILRGENYRLALDVVVFAFDQGRYRLGAPLSERIAEAGRTQATRFADRSQGGLLLAPAPL